jgi:hypothetical protein
LGWVCNLEAGKILNSEWLGAGTAGIQSREYHFMDFIRISFIGIFTGEFGSIDKNLWTMAAELNGSFFVFAVSAALTGIRFRILVCAIAYWLIYKYFGDFTYYFMYGVLLGETRRLGVFDLCHRSYIVRVVSLIIIPLIPLACVYPHLVPWSRVWNVWEWMQTDWMVPFMITTVIYASKDAVGFMRNRLSLFLGRISFCLYSLQQHIVATLLSYMIIEAHEKGEALDETFAVYASTLCILVAIGTATVLEKFEAFYLVYLDRVAKFFLVSKLNNKSKTDSQEKINIVDDYKPVPH